jgi:nicotinate-nucleotide--dimethylbenzimidazole phosphoribosyltransferase
LERLDVVEIGGQAVVKADVRRPQHLPSAMTRFPSFAAPRAARQISAHRCCRGGIGRGNAALTKPGSRLSEDLAVWLAQWQGRSTAARRHRGAGVRRQSWRCGAGRFGISGRGDGADGEFCRRRRAINQLAAVAGARLRVVPSTGLPRTSPKNPPWTRTRFCAPSHGYDSVPGDADFARLGEMGIGNATAAAAIAAALFGGGMRWPVVGPAR